MAAITLILSSVKVIHLKMIEIILTYGFQEDQELKQPSTQYKLPQTYNLVTKL